MGPALRRQPVFFMAADGHMAFPNHAAAMAAIPELVRTIKQIELRWGDDLRVDPLTPDLAAVGTSYHEVRVSPDGHRVEEDGFFTGIAERKANIGHVANHSVTPEEAEQVILNDPIDLGIEIVEGEDRSLNLRAT